MSLTTDDLQLSLAYALSETSAPNDSTTSAQRLEWLNQGYLAIGRRRNWWWLEATDITNTNTGSTTGYPEPTDLKEFIELKVGDIFYNQIPYRQNRDGATTLVTLPSMTTSREFYRYGGEYFFMITDADDAEVHTIKYYKRLSKVADGGTFLIPDEYLEVLVKYAEGRFWESITQQDKAASPYQQFEEILQEMQREQGRRGSGWKEMSQIREPEDATY